MSSNFTFLKTEWPDLFESATRAEELSWLVLIPGRRASTRGAALGTHWLSNGFTKMMRHCLKLPYQDNLSALIHEPTFRNALGPTVFAKAKLIKDLGNLAVHSHKTRS